MRCLLPLSASLALVTLAACAGVGQPDAAPTTNSAVSESTAKPSPRGAVLRWHKRANADGTIPEGALYREALAHRERLAGMPQLSGGPTNWQSMGPGNIGGRIRSILIHPTNPSIMYVGSVGGGAWKTTNAGSSWTMLPDLPIVLAITTMVMHPNDPDTIYAGTGESAFFDNVVGSSNSAVNVGAGVFKSTDAGQTWTQLASTAGAAWNSVCRLAIDKNNPSIMLAGTVSGLYRSTDGGVSWSLRSAGTTFDVEIDPNDSSKCVAGRGDGRAQYSTDGGVTWTNTATFSNATRIELTYARGTANMVFAAVNARGALAVYRSFDGGQTYALRSSSIVSVLSNYTGAIWVDPTNSSRVVVGGLDLYRSTNAGASFSRISRWSSYPNSAHADHHMIVEHPQFGSSNRTVFFGTDGGIQRASNVDTVATTSGWTNLNNGLSITQFYGGCVNPISEVMLGGAQDNGTDRGVPGNIDGWTSPLGGDGSFCASDPVDPNIFYMQYQFIGLRRSTNGANSSGSDITGSISESSPNFMAYILLDPNDRNRLYVCGEELWRANNARTGSPPSWTSVKPSLNCPSASPPPPAHFSDNPPCNISTVAVAPGNSNVVWVGHNNGHVYFTTNALSGSPSWTRVDNNGTALPDRWVSRIVIDHVDSNRVTVSFMGFASPNVWRSEDSGASWSARSGSGGGALPAVPVSCIVQHRVVREAYYAATDLGLFYTEDDGLNWNPAVGGPTIVPMDEVFWKNDRTLMVATHGRSMWSCDVTPADVTQLGGGCGITAPPSLSATPPVIGSTQVYTLSAGSPGVPAALGISGGPPNPTSIGTCVIQPNLTGLIMLSSGSTNGAGGLTKNLPIPAYASLLGAELTAQMFTATAGGPLLGVGEVSNGVTMTFGF